MRPSRNRHEASDLDLEAAFAPEPELRMHGPASIVPEPIEGFADEPGTDSPAGSRTGPSTDSQDRSARRATAADPTACTTPADLLSESATNLGPDTAPGVSGDGHARLRGGVRVARGDALSARRRDRDGGL